jgi:energy-coupling factor transporter transmembrane protein EcfT
MHHSDLHGGWFLSLVIFSPTFALFGTSLWYSWFFDGILSSGAVWAINAIVEWFEENRLSNQKIETTYIVEDENGPQILND